MEIMKKFIKFIEDLLCYEDYVPSLRKPIVTDRLIDRYNRLQCLRQIAHEQKNFAKIWQANRLIMDVTYQINNRAKYFQHFNFN
jgi:hypothetical protein